MPDAAAPPARMVNATLLDQLQPGSGFEKRAQDAVNEYVRMKIREDGFWRRILPPVQITNDELDRQVDTDKPVKVVDMEPNSPAAVSLPFATLPLSRYIRGPRFRVMFDRIVTPRFTKDVEELRTWDMDIRQVLSDNALKDLLAEEDGKAIATVDAILLGPDVVLPETGVAQWVTIPGGITRDTVAEAFKVLPRTPAHLNAATVLINNISIWDIVKWGRDEIGGDFSEELLRQGFAEREFMGARWIITIKTDLVPENVIYMFAEPKFLGKFFRR